MNRPLAAIAIVLAASTATEARAAPAQHAVRATVDQAYVGVGEVIRYSIVLRTHGALEVDASSPGKIDGFDVVGQSQMPGQSMTIVNGVVDQYSTFTVTYRLRAKKAGKFTLGPGKFVVGGKAFATDTVPVEVYAGSAPPRDPLDDLLNNAFDEPPPPLPKAEPLDPQAKIDALPTDPNERDFFARVVADDARPVVGAQVTLKVFVYARHPPKVLPKRPPGAIDFRAMSLGSIDNVWHPLTIADQAWSYAALEAHAAFPLHLGKLRVGPALVTAAFQDFFGKSGERDFESPPLELEAVEPPLDGRPPGYVLGDVASNLRLEADVVPRKVVDGHALLTLNLAGAGRLDTLRPVLPTPAGVTWTNTSDESHATFAALTVNGTRKMQLDARFDRPGDFELGDAVVHVWDPSKKAYTSARAPLGVVRVERPADPPKAEGTPAAPTLPPPRGALGKIGEGASLAERGWTWGLVFGAPTLVALGQTARAAAARRRRREGARASDPAELARAALAEARAGRDVAANVARALDRAVEAATGVRARGLTRAELANALEGSSLTSPLRDEVLDALAALEEARFSGVAPPATSDVAALVERVLGAPKRPGATS